MNKKRNILLLAGISAFLLCFVIIVQYEGDRKIETFAQCIGLFSLVSLFLSGILVFRPPESLDRWIRFARIFIPLTTILATFSTSNGSDLMSIDGESLAFFFTFLYAAISIVRISKSSSKTPKPS